MKVLTTMFFEVHVFKKQEKNISFFILLGFITRDYKGYLKYKL